VQIVRVALIRIVSKAPSAFSGVQFNARRLRSAALLAMRAGRLFRRSELSECVDTRLFSMAAPPRAPAREAARMVLIGCAARPF
jgi:hypothetical protein